MGKSLVNGGKEYNDDELVGRRINISKATMSPKHGPCLGCQIYITLKVRSKKVEKATEVAWDKKATLEVLSLIQQVVGSHVLKFIMSTEERNRQ